MIELLAENVQLVPGADTGIDIVGLEHATIALVGAACLTLVGCGLALVVVRKVVLTGASYYFAFTSGGKASKAKAVYRIWRARK